MKKQKQKLYMYNNRTGQAARQEDKRVLFLVLCKFCQIRFSSRINRFDQQKYKNVLEKEIVKFADLNKPLSYRFT